MTVLAQLRSALWCPRKAGLRCFVLFIAGSLLFVISLSACSTRAGETSASPKRAGDKGTAADNLIRRPASNPSQIRLAVDSAIEQTKRTIEYDPSYAKLAYPGGDVPIERGACADVIVRAFRSAGVDLQKELHEDMVRSFGKYPTTWGARKPDSNIDHRRVPNLMTFFSRAGKSVPITKRQSDYLPGDVVAWELDNHLLHIGLVTDAVADKTQNYSVVHNIGAGARLEDVLFAWKIIGHYRMWK
jgi:uncharacterized protein YijF (DUF1287 family)